MCKFKSTKNNLSLALLCSIIVTFLQGECLLVAFKPLSTTFQHSDKKYIALN